MTVFKKGKPIGYCIFWGIILVLHGVVTSRQMQNPTRVYATWGLLNCHATTVEVKDGGPLQINLI